MNNKISFIFEIWIKAYLTGNINDRQEWIIRTRFIEANYPLYIGKNSYNIRILFQIFTSSYEKFALYKIQGTLRLNF